jgi:hypothetical protein
MAESLGVGVDEGVKVREGAGPPDGCAGTCGLGFGFEYGSGATPEGGFGSGAGSVVVVSGLPAAAGANITAARTLPSSSEARRPTCGR